MACSRAVVLALLALPCQGYVQECWSMGETCGDESRCTGMGTHCGDRSECSGSSTTCGAGSICSGMDSRCGPGSQCTGLGAQCDGGSQAMGGSSQQQSQGGGSMTFAPMTWKPMSFKPMTTARPPTVYVHGCDQNEVCQNRPGAAQSNGVTVCCKEGCEDCSASTSQSGDVLTATCVCNDQKQRQKQGPKVNAKGCETGDVCNSRPGAASANGQAFCCPAHCGTCQVYGQQVGDTLTAMCMCDGQQQLAEEKPAEAGAPVQVPPFVALMMFAAISFAILAVTLVAKMWSRPSVHQEPLLA